MKVKQSSVNTRRPSAD